MRFKTQEAENLLNRIDPTIKRETAYIALCVLIMSMLMQSVFLIISAWDWTVLWGNLLGGFAAVLNFFLMGLTIQKALGKDKKDAASLMKASQSLRMVMLLAFAAVGALAPCFNLIAVVVPLVFPRIGIFFRPMLDKKVKE